MFFGLDNLREPGTKKSDCCYDIHGLRSIDRETSITVKTEKKMKLQYNCPTAGTGRNERKHLKMLSTSFLLMLIKESKAHRSTSICKLQ